LQSQLLFISSIIYIEPKKYISNISLILHHLISNMSTETDNTFSIENYSIQNGEYYFYERFFSYIEKMDCVSVNNKMYKANMYSTSYMQKH
jgi:hypothetical protein